MKYKVVEGSESSHCCFKATVINTSKKNKYSGNQKAICECFDKEDAKLITEALNKYKKNKQKIIFYKKKSDVVGIIGVYLSGTHTPNKINEILDSFESGEIKVLFVPSPMVTGWKTSLTEDDVQVEFIGDEWKQSEIAQGRNRVTPKIIL